MNARSVGGAAFIIPSYVGTVAERAGSPPTVPLGGTVDPTVHVFKSFNNQKLSKLKASTII